MEGLVPKYSTCMGLGLRYYMYNLHVHAYTHTHTLCRTWQSCLFGFCESTRRSTQSSSQVSIHSPREAILRVHRFEIQMGLVKALVRQILLECQCSFLLFL